MSYSLSMSSASLAGTALIAGALVPLQAGSNAALGRALGHPLWASATSLLVSLLVLLPLLLAARVPSAQFAQATQLPVWAWFGGIAGVVYITSALLLTPRLGASGFIVCVIAGQLLISLLIDHLGLMGLPTKAANPGRIAGVALIFAGMLLVQWFTPTSAPPG